MWYKNSKNNFINALNDTVNLSPLAKFCTTHPIPCLHSAPHSLANLKSWANHFTVLSESITQPGCKWLVRALFSFFILLPFKLVAALYNRRTSINSKLLQDSCEIIYYNILDAKTFHNDEYQHSEYQTQLKMILPFPEKCCQSTFDSEEAAHLYLFENTNFCSWDLHKGSFM